jgi:hypothetical protein
MQLFTPFEYLCIDVANQFGKDKDLYEDRIQWTKDNLNQLEELVGEADSPNMYWKAVDAVRCAQKGIPTGHLVGFDAAASGPQMLSTLARCKVGMRNTGVLNTPNATYAPDIYKECTNHMGRKSYVRKAVKSALMCYYYGSDMQPKITFGEGEDLELFLLAAKHVAPEAFDLRSILLGLADPTRLDYTYTMPDRGVVHKRVWVKKDYRIQEPLLGSSFTFRTKVNEGKEDDKALAADVTHSIDSYVVREINRRCNFNKEQLWQALAIINTLGDIEVTDRSKMMSLVEVEYLTVDTIGDYTLNQLAQLKEQIETSLKYGSFECVFIHDEFKCHANYMNILRKHYNIILWEMYHSNLLADIVKQISGLDLQVNEFDQQIADEILDANYPIN